MKVKIALVAVLSLVALGLAILLLWPNIMQSSDDSIKPDIKPLALKYASKEYRIKFEYPSDFEVTEAPATKIYDSTEAVVYSFVSTTRPYVAPIKISVYSFPQQDSIDALVERVKADFPSAKSYQCKKSTDANKCVYLVADEANQLPFHFLTESSSGLDASFVDMPRSDYHIDEDYVFFPEPAKTFFETAERI